MSLYLLLNSITFGTFLLSFDKKVAFYKKFKGLFIGIVVNMLLFIPWDIMFTIKGVWGFNPTYLNGLNLFKLPLEEWLFFITVPYSCVFIFFVLKAYFKNPISEKTATLFWYILSISLIVIGLFFTSQAYTFYTFMLTPIVLLILVIKEKGFMKDFLWTYLVALIPFIIINGILTGAITDEPVVWYNNNENFGIRFITIPIEDFVYNMLLLVIPTFITTKISKK